MGHYLATPNKEKHTEETEHGPMRYVASSMQGWRVNMEDAHIAKFDIAPDTSLFGVFDGHGGAEVAKFVAKHFTTYLLESPSFKSGDYSKALSDLFIQMDEILKTPEGKKELSTFMNASDRSGGYDDNSYAGCTSCVGLMVKDKLYVANAGDSRCMVATKGDVHFLTEDHKPDNQKEKDRIERAGGEVMEGRINGRLNLSRAIGDFDYKGNSQLKYDEQLVIVVPDMRIWNITPDDEMLILGCDGIWECLPPKQIYDFLTAKLKSGKNLKSSVEEFLDYIVANDTQTGIGLDNMTIVVVMLK